ncbi:MAG: metallophosphoesterase [Thermoplasmata archaeon]
MECIFVSDLHGNTAKYSKLYELISKNKPSAVFIGGDILPHRGGDATEFIEEHIISKAISLPTRFFMILGNDDPRIYESVFIEADKKGYIEYVHNRARWLGDHCVFGYSYVPPTPFMLKDWERYDVSRYVDVGSTYIEDGFRTVEVEDERFQTIKDDLDNISQVTEPDKTIYLFHSPPYDTALDLTGNAGTSVNHAPMDPHVGSIAIKKFIEEKKPFLTLHGHIHESPGLTGCWKEKIGRTYSLSAAHDGPELAAVLFDTASIKEASRILIEI